MHYRWARDPVPILQEAVWAPVPLQMGEKNFNPHCDSIPRSSSPQQVAIPSAMLSPPLHRDTRTEMWDKRHYVMKTVDNLRECWNSFQNEGHHIIVHSQHMANELVYDQQYSSVSKIYQTLRYALQKTRMIGRFLVRSWLYIRQVWLTSSSATTTSLWRANWKKTTTDAPHPVPPVAPHHLAKTDCW